MSPYRLLLPAALLSCITPALAAVTVQGNLKYQDKLYDQYGYTGGTANRPIRYATIQILNTSNSVLASSYTDGSGNFSVYVSGLSGGLQFNLRVFSETQAAVVKDTGLFGGTWYVPWVGLTAVAPTTSLSLATITGDGAAIFNILDVCINGFQYRLR